MGLPHRNYSVFKQTPINQWQIKVVVIKTRASEAKGPFSGREEGWELGEEKERKENKRERHWASISGLPSTAR